MVAVIILLSLSVLPCFAEIPVHVEDAFVEADSGGQAWTIGTDAVEMKYVVRDGRF